MVVMLVPVAHLMAAMTRSGRGNAGCQRGDTDKSDEEGSGEFPGVHESPLRGWWWKRPSTNAASPSPDDGAAEIHRRQEAPASGGTVVAGQAP